LINWRKREGARRRRRREREFKKIEGNGILKNAWRHVEASGACLLYNKNKKESCTKRCN